MSYILGIVGARTFTEYSKLECGLMDIITERGLPEAVVSGGARGADTLAIKWASNKGIKMINHTPLWGKYGKSAAYIRNVKIVEDADIVLAFPSKKGKGTQMTLKIAESQGVPCVVITDWE